MRHAQSAEKQGTQLDIERELTPAGMKESAAIGHFLKKNNYEVDLMVSSEAKRAQSTAALIHGILNIKSDFIVHEELYEASVRNLLEVIGNLDNEFKNILLIGHNPYISYFAEYLTKAEIGSMDTGGLVSISFDISNWYEVSEGSGSLDNYVCPSDLA